MTNVIDLFPEPPKDDPLAFLESLEQSLLLRQPITRFEPHLGCFLTSVQPDNWFRVFASASRILARIDWTSLAEPELSQTRSSGATGDRDDRVKSLADSVVEAFVDGIREEEQLHAMAAKRGLTHFPPAYAYLDAFDTYFGNDSPIDYINEALQILSRNEPYVHPDDCWFPDDGRRTLDSVQLAFYINDLFVPLMVQQATVAPSAKESAEGEKWQNLRRLLLMVPAIGLPQLFTGKLSDFYLDKVEFPSFDGNRVSSDLSSLLQHIDSAAGFLALMIRPGLFPLPQGLLVALVRRFLDDAYETGEELGARIGFHLLNWPLGMPQESWEEVEASLVAPQWGSDLRTLYPGPSDVPFLPCRMLSQSLHMLYDNDAALCFGLEDDRTGLYGQMLGKYSDKLDTLTAKLNGYFPWPTGGPGNWFYLGFGEPSESWNLQLLLQVADADGSIWEKRYPSDDPNDKRSPFHIYGCLRASANRQGFPKLGNALFSFYLFRKLIHCVDSNSPPRYVAEPLRTQLDLNLATPGHTWVIRTLEISRQVCKQKGWGIDWLVLDSLTNGDSETTLSPEALTKSPDPIIDLSAQREKQLAEEVGPAWLRLSDRFRRMICHAEAQFERDAPHLGTSEREYKGHIIDFVVPFEIELGDRLEGLYISQEMQEHFLQNWRGYKKPSKPCLWDFLHLLKEFPSMSASLQVLVRQRVGAVAESGAVLKSLDKLRERSRNKAGHRDASPPQDLVMTRELIFAKGLLKDFAAALSDRDTN